MLFSFMYVWISLPPSIKERERKERREKIAHLDEVPPPLPRVGEGQVEDGRQPHAPVFGGKETYVCVGLLLCFGFWKGRVLIIVGNDDDDDDARLDNPNRSIHPNRSPQNHVHTQTRRTYLQKRR